MLDPVLKETPSVRMIALSTLWSYFEEDPYAKFSFALGWFHEEYPILDLEANLLGLTLEEGVEQTTEIEEDY